MPALIEPKAEQWALANLPYFRELGFFPDLIYRSDADVLAEILNRYVTAEGAIYVQMGKTPPTPKPWKFWLEPPLMDLELLRFDSSRVWWEDTECVYPPHVLAYEDAFSIWAKISRGAFAPQQITETWAGSDDEPNSPAVRIKLPEGTLTLTPIDRNDWFDLTTLIPINHYIRDSGVSLELYHRFDQTAFVVALTPREKQQLQTIRRWSFHRFDDELQPKW